MDLWISVSSADTAVYCACLKPDRSTGFGLGVFLVSVVLAYRTEWKAFILFAVFISCRMTTALSQSGCAMVCCTSSVLFPLSLESLRSSSCSWTLCDKWWRSKVCVNTAHEIPVSFSQHKLTKRHIWYMVEMPCCIGNSEILLKEGKSVMHSYLGRIQFLIGSMIPSSSVNGRRSRCLAHQEHFNNHSMNCSGVLSWNCCRNGWSVKTRCSLFSFLDEHCRDSFNKTCATTGRFTQHHKHVP